TVSGLLTCRTRPSLYRSRTYMYLLPRSPTTGCRTSCDVHGARLRWHRNRNPSRGRTSFHALRRPPGNVLDSSDQPVRQAVRSIYMELNVRQSGGFGCTEEVTPDHVVERT